MPLHTPLRHHHLIFSPFIQNFAAEILILSDLFLHSLPIPLLFPYFSCNTLLDRSPFNLDNPQTTQKCPATVIAAVALAATAAAVVAVEATAVIVRIAVTAAAATAAATAEGKSFRLLFSFLVSLLRLLGANEAVAMLPAQPILVSAHSSSARTTSSSETRMQRANNSRLTIFSPVAVTDTPTAAPTATAAVALVAMAAAAVATAVVAATAAAAVVTACLLSVPAFASRNGVCIVHGYISFDRFANQDQILPPCPSSRKISTRSTARLRTAPRPMSLLSAQSTR